MMVAILQSKVQFQSMAGCGLVSGSLTTKSEGLMKRSGTLEEPSDCDFIRDHRQKYVFRYKTLTL